MKYEDHDIILIEDYPCDTKHALHSRERHWIEQLNCVNRIIPTRTQAEYHQLNRVKINNQHKEYYNDNKEDFLKKCKVYRENNRDKKNNQDKKYRLENKAILSVKQNEKFKCGCTGTYTRTNKAIHCKSVRHIEYIKQLPNNETI